jgi:hypothetical protein
MTIKNLDAIKARIRAAAQAKADKMADGLKLCALTLLAASQSPFVPVDYSNLKASGGVRERDAAESGIAGATITWQVAYTAGYAVYVHENPDAAHGQAFNIKHAAELAKHPKTGPYRHNRGPEQQYKFLEKPFRQMVNDGTFFAIMQQAMR